MNDSQAGCRHVWVPSAHRFASNKLPCLGLRPCQPSCWWVLYLGCPHKNKAQGILFLCSRMLCDTDVHLLPGSGSVIPMMGATLCQADSCNSSSTGSTWTVTVKARRPTATAGSLSAI